MESEKLNAVGEIECSWGKLDRCFQVFFLNVSEGAATILLQLKKKKKKKKSCNNFVASTTRGRKIVNSK